MFSAFRPPVSLLLLALLPIIPWLAPWHLQPVVTFHLEWLAVLCGLLAVFAVLARLWHAENLHLPSQLWLPLGLAGYIGLQAALLPQVVAPHAVMAVLYLCWAAALMLLVAFLRQQFGSERVGLWLAGGLASAAVWAALRELVNRLSGEIGDWGGIGQPNLYADLVALGGASLLYWKTTGQLPRAISIFLGVCIVLGLSLTASRSVLLYWVAGAFIVWRYRPDGLKWIVAGFGVYIALQGLWALNVLPDAQPTMTKRLVQEASGTSPRWHIWQVAWQLFLQSPFLGQGFGQFDTAYFNAGRFIPALPTYVEHAHNLILHLLAELGLLPVLLLVLSLTRWLGPLMTRRSTIADQAMQAWLLLMTAILGIHSLLEYPLWYSPFLGIAALILGMGDTLRHSVRWNKTRTTIAGTGVALALSVAVLHEWHYTRIELALLASVAQPSQQRSNHLVDACQTAVAEAPLLKPYVPMIFTFTGQPSDVAMRPQLTVLADAAVRFVPGSNFVYRLALMQALSGNQAQSEQTLRQAVAAYPNDASKFIVDIFHLQGLDSARVNFMLPILAPALGAKIVAHQQMTSMGLSR